MTNPFGHGHEVEIGDVRFSLSGIITVGYKGPMNVDRSWDGTLLEGCMRLRWVMLTVHTIFFLDSTVANRTKRQERHKHAYNP